VGWWPGDARYGVAAFYAYGHPAPATPEAVPLPSPARWDGELGLYLLDWDDARSSDDPHALALDFARAVFRHVCEACGWDPALPASAEGAPPP